MSLLLALVVALGAVDGFTPTGLKVSSLRCRASSISPTPQIVTTRTSLYSTTSNSTITDLNNDEITKKELLAKEALTKLLEKQKREMRTTEELIENLLDSESRSLNLETNAEDMKSKKTSTAQSLAQSIYAGVDYGFISRSEGPRVESVDDLNE